MHRWWRSLPTLAALAALIAIVAFAAEALAQSTGGSFGGGSFGGGGSSGGSSGGYSGGGYSGGGYSGGGGGGDGIIGLIFLAFRINPIFGLLVTGVVVVAVIARGAMGGFGGGGGSASPRWNQPMVVHQPQVVSAAPSGSARAWMNADVTKVRIAVDLASRQAIETELTALWSTTNVGMKGGLLRVVHRTAQLLRAHEPAWRYAGESNFHPMSPPQAESIFRQLSDAARMARTAGVTPTNAQGSVFLVTIIVAARREIVDFHAHRPEQLRMILDDLMRLAEQDLVAAEISWLPLESGAGMSPTDLARVYRDMRGVEHGAPGAAQAIAAAAAAQAHGRIFCPWCGKDYARQHPRCVHCGGTRPGENG